jgi:hypothetical protein
MVVIISDSIITTAMAPDYYYTSRTTKAAEERSEGAEGAEKKTNYQTKRCV